MEATALTATIVLTAVFAAALCIAILFTLYVYVFYSKFIDRIFEERPFLIADQGSAAADAETVLLEGRGRRRIVGSYLKRRSGERRGVVLFLHEFGATRWLANEYAGFLRDDGHDVFTIDFCGQGESEPVAGYEPLHWPTEHEVDDASVAIAYLESRKDADPRGVAVFGVSKGGGVGIAAASRSPYVRAVVTDGAFPILGMVVHFAMKWIELYSTSRFIYMYLPRWFYALICRLRLRAIARRKGVRYPSVERSIRRLAGRPLLMIVGQRDSYVRKEIAESLFKEAREPKQLWFVKRAKHNGCLDAAGDEYRRRVREFLANGTGPAPEEAHRPSPTSRKALGAPIERF